MKCNVCFKKFFFICLFLIILTGCSSLNSKINCYRVRYEYTMNHVFIVNTLDDYKHFINDDTLRKEIKEEYFEKNSLLMFPLTEPSGSYEVAVKSYKIENNFLNIEVETKIPSIGTNDMAYYMVVIEVSNEEIKDLKVARVYENGNQIIISSDFNPRYSLFVPVE